MSNDFTEKDNLNSANNDNEKVEEIFEIIQRGTEEILVEGDLKKSSPSLCKKGNH